MRPVLATDLPTLEEIDFGVDEAFDWRYSGSVPSPQSRLASAWAGVLDQRVFVRLRDQCILGYGTLYLHNPRSGTAWLAVAAAPIFQRTGAALLGAGLYITVCFSEWPLRAIHAESAGHSLAAVSSGIDGVAVRISGCLKNARRRPDGGHTDVNWLTIERGPWMDSYGNTFLDAVGREDG